jgi:uncharacterized phage protein (TIGR01671 family)
MLDWLVLCQTAFNTNDRYSLLYDVIVNRRDYYEVMQYTGLSDKKGNEIYEGDIIELNGKYRYKVVFEDAKFVCYHVTKVEWGRWGDLKRLTDPDFSEYHYEVIGNIYQNQNEARLP